jgi:cytochrome b
LEQTPRALKPVWDLPTRLFHWLLVGLIAFSWWSAEYHHLDWHLLAGLSAVGLIVFRLIWGFVGGSTARFSDFVRGPRAAVIHIRGDGRKDAIGHNPLGGWSVLALLLATAAVLGFGLFAVDTDGLESGPLARFVSFDVGRVAAELHHTAFNLLLALIALHLAAIAYYAVVKRQNLVGAMVTGRKRLPDQAGMLRPAGIGGLIAAVVVAVGVVGLLLRMSG